ncbi:MAG: uroporphyrinogen-III synthase [Polaromonas sp.]
MVTRPAREAQHWVAQLQQAGIQAEALPLIDIAPAADTQALSQAWQALGSYTVCMFVSGNAVDYFFQEKTGPAQQIRAQSAINTIAQTAVGAATPVALPAAMRFMAPGPGTVAALIAAGVPPDQIDAPAADAAQFDSQSLWQVVGARNWQGCRVLVVRGESDAAQGSAGSPGRDWIARQWRAAGAQVEFVSVYQRRAPTLTAPQIDRVREAARDGSVWLFSSSEAVGHLLAQKALQGMDWQEARAVATHPRIAEVVRAAGWGVVVASRPALQDIKDTLRSIESLHP